MANDNFGGAQASITALYLGPGTTPNPGPFSDANDLPAKTRAVHVSVAGNVKYTANGVTITEAWEVGWHPVRLDRIFVTGTTATLVAWS